MYKLVRVSALSGEPGAWTTPYSLLGSDVVYATVGTATNGPSLSSVKLTLDELGDYFDTTITTWVSSGSVLYHKDSKGIAQNGMKIGINTTTPAVALSINSTDAILVPVGNEGARPTPATGMVRYNTDDNQFEGYHSSTWRGLGGVIDVDQDTKIQAEESTDEDKLRFDTAGSQRMVITDTGKVGINTDNPSKLLHVKESSSTVPCISAEGELHVSGDIIVFSTSDERLKSNIMTIQSPLEKLSYISGVTFEWNDLAPHKHGTDYGVIAQEVEAVLPEAVIERDTGYKAVDYEKLIPLLIESVKELSEKVKRLEDKDYGGQ